MKVKWGIRYLLIVLWMFSLMGMTVTLDGQRYDNVKTIEITEGGTVTPPVVTPPASGLPADWNWQVYVNAYIDLRNAGITTQILAEKHYREFGKNEGRWPPPGYVSPNPSVPSGSWTPPIGQGLHLILDAPGSGREFYSVLRIPDGLLLGDYGEGHGGARIQKYDGGLHDELITDRESIFDLFMPPDGRPVATAEHFGSIYKRNAAGVWVLVYSTGRYEDLAFYCRRTDDGALWVLINGYTNQQSSLVKSTDNGNTWVKAFDFPAGQDLYGMTADGNDLFLTGKQGGAQILVDQHGNKIIDYDPGDNSGYQLWGVIKKDGIFNVGTWNSTSMSDGCYINWHDGSLGMQVAPPIWNADGSQNWHPIGTFVQAMGIAPSGDRYAVMSYGWGQEGQAVLLKSDANGQRWIFVTQIPCPQIGNMSFADNGIYLAGGAHEQYGRIYFYKY